MASSTQNGLKTARRMAAAFGALSLAVTLSACGGGQPAVGAGGPADEGGDKPIALNQSDFDGLVTAAESEGEVLIYTSHTPTEAAFKKFSETYPDIEVKIERAPTADLIARLDQELSVNASSADLVLHAQPGWYEDRGEERSLAPLKIGPDAQNATSGVELGRYYLPVARAPYSISFNTALGQPVATASELLDVIGDRAVGIVDAANSIPQSYQYYKWQELYGQDFLQRLKDKSAGVYTSGPTMAQSLGAGELVFGLGQPPGDVANLKAQGAPIDEAVPAEGVVGAQYGAGVLTTSPHPNAAQLVANWLLSPEGQNAFVEALGGAVFLEPEGSRSWDSVEVPTWTSEEQKNWLETEWNPVFRG